MVLVVEDLCMGINLQTTHGVVHTGHTSIDPIRSRAEICEASTIVEVRIVPGLSKGVHTRYGRLQILNWNLEEVGDIVKRFAFMQNAGLGKGFYLILMVRNCVRLLFNGIA